MLIVKRYVNSNYIEQIATNKVEVYNKTKPVKLLKAKAASIMIINLMNCVLQNLPSLISIFRIHHHPMLKRFYLKRLLLLTTHPSFNSNQKKKKSENYKQSSNRIKQLMINDRN